MRLLAIAVIALVGCTGDAGPEGPEGPQGPNGTGTPSLSAISPNHAFAARTVDVVISGDDTAFDAATTIDFGAGITVDKLTVVSVTQLAARITIDETAAMGTRDVTVTSNGALVATMGFEIQSAMTMQLLGGPLLAGDIALMQTVSNDDQPLSSASLIDQLDHVLFLNTTAPQPAVEGPQALVVLVEPTASGPQQLIWRNQGFGGRVFVSDTQTLAVGARTPTMLGVNATGTIAFDTRSKLFSYNAPGLGIVSGLLFSVGSALTPRFALLPGTGVFDPLDFAVGGRLSFAGVVRPGATMLDLILSGGDETGTDTAHSLGYGVLYNPVSAITPESGTAHGVSAPQTMTSPAILDGTLAATDVDAYSIALAMSKGLELSYKFSDPVLFTLVNTANTTVVTQVPLNGGGSFVFPNSGAAGNVKIIIEPANGQAATYTLSFRVP